MPLSHCSGSGAQGGTQVTLSSFGSWSSAARVPHLPVRGLLRVSRLRDARRVGPSASRARPASRATAGLGSFSAARRAGSARESPRILRVLAACCRTYHFGSETSTTARGFTARGVLRPDSAAALCSRTPPLSSRSPRMSVGIARRSRSLPNATADHSRTTVLGSRADRRRAGTALGSPIRDSASAAEDRQNKLYPRCSARRRDGTAGLPIFDRATVAARRARSPPPLPMAWIRGSVAAGSPISPSSTAARLLVSEFLARNWAMSPPPSFERARPRSEANAPIYGGGLMKVPSHQSPVWARIFSGTAFIFRYAVSGGRRSPSTVRRSLESPGKD